MSRITTAKSNFLLCQCFSAATGRRRLSGRRTRASGMQPVCLFISLELSLRSHRAPPGSPDLTRSPANIPAIPGTTTRLESCDFLVPLLPEVDVFPVLFFIFFLAAAAKSHLRRGSTHLICRSLGPSSLNITVLATAFPGGSPYSVSVPFPFFLLFAHFLLNDSCFSRRRR